MFWRQQLIQKFLSEGGRGAKQRGCVVFDIPDGVMIKEIRASTSKEDGLKVTHTARGVG